MTSEPNKSRVGIICGGGSIPVEAAEAAVSAGHDIYLIAIRGEADSSVERFPHSWIKWGEIGRLFDILNKENCTEIVIVGSVKRPDLSQIRFDLGAVKNLPFILGLRTGGDDSVLSNIVKFFEGKGFPVRGAHDIAPCLLSAAGLVAGEAPEDGDLDDIETGLEVVKVLGPFDVGQAVVVARGYVLAVEAAEGTDAMLRRCKELRQWGAKGRGQRSGVLTKCPKPGQDLRVDLPAIGPKTVELAAEAGLRGIAVRAGHVLLASRARLAETAQRHGIFVFGLDRER